MRVHALQEALEAEGLDGVVDLTPGIRSLQVHTDAGKLRARSLIPLLQRVEDELPPTHELRVPSRTVRLPLSWDDPATRLAIERYMAGVRADAPWTPWNIEFIRRVNGLESVDGRPRHRVRREVPGPRPRRRLPRRAGRHPARPTAPAGDHQVQPGADLDGGELRRHRRRVPVHLRHGGPRRLPVRRPHHPGVEPVPPRRAVRRAAVAPAVLRPDRVVPGQRRGTARPAGGDRRRARPRRGDRRLVRLRVLHPVPGARRGGHRGLPVAAGGRVRGGEGALAGVRRVRPGRRGACAERATADAVARAGTGDARSRRRSSPASGRWRHGRAAGSRRETSSSRWRP